MPDFKITISYETIVKDVPDEEEARREFFQNTIYDTQTDPGTFIEDHLEVEELPNDEVGDCLRKIRDRYYNTPEQD